MRRCVLLVLLLSAALGSVPRAIAQDVGGVEVLDVPGIVDGSVERAVLAGIEAAEREGAALVVLQIDSTGVVDARRARRIAGRVKAARVPVATWVGPARARAAHGSVLVAGAGHVRAMAPGATLGPAVTLDLRGEVPPPPSATLARPLSAEEAEARELVDVVAPSLRELLEEIDGAQVVVGGREVRISADPERSRIRLHKLDLFGRALHAAAQPSIGYLLLLLGLVGVVFELFHPSTGPAGIAGAGALALSLYGVVVLGGSWLGVALVVAGVVGFAVDLRFQSLGVATLLGFGGLVAGSILLYSGPRLRVSPWVLGFGIAAMVAFLLGAMTRVLRDLRAVARGELEVRDAHPHPDGDGGPHAP